VLTTQQKLQALESKVNTNLDGIAPFINGDMIDFKKWFIKDK